MSESQGRLVGKVAIVTGGASGIGAAVCATFAREGAEVITGDLDAAGLATTVDTVMDSGGRCVAVEADVSTGQGVDALVAKAVEAFGGVDAVVTCAGVPSPTPLTELTEAEWDRTFAVNARGVMLAAQRAAPAIAQRGGGAIVTIGSAAALVILPGQPAYCASKGAVVTLSKALAGELVEQRIRVNCICPGIIRTPMFMRYFAEQFPDEDERAVAFAEMEGADKLGRVAEPGEIAAAALFLCSDDASYVNGAVLSVDGGLTAVK